MFSNKKKSFFKSKIFYGCIIVALLAFGVWINYEPEPKDENANARTKVEETTQQNASETSQSPLIVDSEEGASSESESDPSGDETEATHEIYYLVREIDGVVKIFYCDENGEESLYEITSIPFDLLSKEDQQLFAEGVHIKNLTELERFMENFDS